MKKQRNTIYLLAALLIGAMLISWNTVAVAQTSTGENVSDDENLEHDKGLGLTDDQKAQLKAIRQKEHDQLKALKNDTSLTPEQKREKAKEIKQASRQQSHGILTPDQQAKVKEHREARRDRREDRRKGDTTGAGRGERTGTGTGTRPTPGRRR